MSDNDLGSGPGYDPEDIKALQERLVAPFPLDAHDFKPQATSKDKTRAMGATYVDPRHYQERLDEVDPMWSSSLIVQLSPSQVFVTSTVIVLGRSRTATGESKLTEENALTSAEAQAFKRACTAHGIGRYLYMLPKTWAEYDADRKRFSDAGITALQTALSRWIKRQGGTRQDPAPSPARAATAHHSAPEKRTPPPAADKPEPEPVAAGGGNGNGNVGPTEFWTAASQMTGPGKRFSDRGQVAAFLKPYGGNWGAALAALNN